MPSNLEMTYPGIETRDEDWRAFFRTQIWKDMKLILRQDYDFGLNELLGENIKDNNEMNRLRGKIDAYREIETLDENILAIISGESEEEESEELETVDLEEVSEDGEG